MNITIEKGVPLPKEREHYGTGLSSTLRTMEVGDSFVIPFNGNVRSTIHSTARSIDIKIVSKRDGDQIRIWRKA